MVHTLQSLLDLLMYSDLVADLLVWDEYLYTMAVHFAIPLFAMPPLFFYLWRLLGLMVMVSSGKWLLGLDCGLVVI